MSKIFTENDAVIVAQSMLRAHHDRRLDDFLPYITDDMIWVGPFEFQRSSGKEEYIKVSASEYAATPIILSKEEYHSTKLAKNLFMVHGRYFCSMFPESGGIITSYPRFVMLIRPDEGALKVFYMHASLAGDQNSFSELTPPKAYYEYISNFLMKQHTLKENDQDKKVLKDINGNYRYLSDTEIIHVKSERVYSRFYSFDEDFLSRISLTETEKLLGDGFLRIHKSHLVNKAYIQTIKGYKAYLTDGTVLPVSRGEYSQIKEHIRE